MKNVIICAALLFFTSQRPPFNWPKTPSGHYYSPSQMYYVYGFGPKPVYRGPTLTTPNGKYRPIKTPWGVQYQRIR